MKKEDIMNHAIEVARHTSKIEGTPYSALCKDFDGSKDTYAQFIKDDKVPKPIKIRFYIKGHESEDRERYESGLVKGFAEECVIIVDMDDPNDYDYSDDSKEGHEDIDIDYLITDIMTISLDQIYMLGYDYEGCEE